MAQTNKLVIQQHNPPDLSPVVNKLGDLVNKLDSIVRVIGTKRANSSDSDISNTSAGTTAKLDEIVAAIKSLTTNVKSLKLHSGSSGVGSSASTNSTVDEALQVAATIFTNMVDKNRLNDEKYYKDIANKSIKLGKILVDTYNRS